MGVKQERVFGPATLASIMGGGPGAKMARRQAEREAFDLQQRREKEALLAQRKKQGPTMNNRWRGAELSSHMQLAAST